MARVFLTGSNIRGVEYIPYALQFFRRLKAIGCRDGNRTTNLGRGTSVRVVLDQNAGDKIYIDSNCAFIRASCFLDTYRKIEYSPITGKPANQWLIAEQNEKENRLAPVPPSEVVEPAMYGIRNKKSHQILETTRILPVEPQLPEGEDITGGVTMSMPDQTTNNFREVFERYTPSKFTGHIRKTMQCAHAIGMFTKATDFVPDYRYDNSFGAVKHREQYFLIRVKNTEVHYVPAQFCITRTEDGREIPQLESTPLKTVDDISGKHTVLDEAALVSLGSFDSGGGSFSNEIGWAFSYTSPEASLVVTRPLSTSAGDNYVTTSLAKLTIVFDDKGAPSGIDFSQTGFQILWNHRPMRPNSSWSIYPSWGLFNVPVYASEDGVSTPTYHNASVNFGPDYPVGMAANNMPPGYRASGVPVYVFYTETGGRHVCTYSFELAAAKTQTGGVASTAKMMSYSYSPGSWSVSYTTTIEDIYDVIKKGFTGSKQEASFYKYSFTVDEEDPAFTSSGEKNDSYIEYRVGRELIGVGQCASIAFRTVNTQLGDIGGVFSTWGDLVEVQRIGVNTTGGGSTVDMSITIPVNEREAVVLFSKKSTTAKTATQTSSTAGWSSRVVPGAGMRYFSMDYGSALVLENTPGWFGPGSGSMDVQFQLNIIKATYGGHYCDVHIHGVPPNETYASSELICEELPSSPVYPGYIENSYSEVWTTVSSGQTSVDPSGYYCQKYDIADACHPGLFFSTYQPNLGSKTATAQVAAMSESSKGASVEYDMRLMTGDFRVDIPPWPFSVNDKMLVQHPDTNSLVYRCAKAAMSPKEYIAYDYDIGKAVVKMGGASYDVANKLFGWVGDI